MIVPNLIEVYFHCGRCVNELPPGESPKDYAKNQMGITKDGGIQVWCNRHDINIALIEADNLAQLGLFGMGKIPSCGHSDHTDGCYHPALEVI